MKRLLPLLIVLFFPAAAVPAGGHEHRSSDVAIYGATPAGIVAAVAAAARDRSVVLVEPTARIGGMVTHGLSHTDFHSFEAINGPFLWFSQRVVDHYAQTYGGDSQQVRDCWRGTHGEPSVNLLVFEQMLAELPSVTALTNHRPVAATVQHDRVTAVRFAIPDAGELTISPRLVIDA
jgi:flavin-dependent dehydrogenase